MAIKKAVPAVYRTACLRYGVETRRYFPPGGAPLAQDFKETSYNITNAVCFINPFISKYRKILCNQYEMVFRYTIPLIIAMA